MNARVDEEQDEEDRNDADAGIAETGAGDDGVERRRETGEEQRRPDEGAGPLAVSIPLP